MKHINLIINARWVVPIDAKQSVLEHHCVAINDGSIVAVMPQLTHCPESNLKPTSAISAHTTLEMATIKSTKALGIDTITGSLKKGKTADIIAVNLSDIESNPCHNVVSQLVYATGRNQVTDVWVDGKQPLKNRQLTTLNQTKIIQNSHKWAAKIRQANR